MSCGRQAGCLGLWGIKATQDLPCPVASTSILEASIPDFDSSTISMFFKLATGLLAATVVSLQANAETHTVTFTNKCGYGTPYLWSQTGTLLSTGGAYTSDGPAPGLIAYLQTGNCGQNGEDCTLVEATLENAGSAADISLIPPHEFSVTSGFGYYGGCDNVGTDCTDVNCPIAFRQPGDTWAIIGCGAANVNLAITFCD